MPGSPLLLDTHAWVWAQLGIPKRLFRAAVTAIQNAESEGALLVSVISTWELAMWKNAAALPCPGAFVRG